MPMKDFWKKYRSMANQKKFLGSLMLHLHFQIFFTTRTAFFRTQFVHTISWKQFLENMSWIYNQNYVRHAKNSGEIGQWQIKTISSFSYAPSTNSYIFSPRGLPFFELNLCTLFLNSNFKKHMSSWKISKIKNLLSLGYMNSVG
jgi:hypothetical protein